MHFHTFDALRFFAFLKVFLLHIPITSFGIFNFFKAGGGFGVQFFFVLSGFLITYIICEEKIRVGQMSLKNFFARRMLRIWPLFYLMILLAFVTPYVLQLLHLPSSSAGYEPNWLASVFFMENYMMMSKGGVLPNVSPLGTMWSLCVEEHFYIVWGFLLYFSSVRHLPAIIISCVVIALICRLTYYQLHIPANDVFSHIDLFAFGAIPAYFLVSNPSGMTSAVKRIPARAQKGFVALLVAAVLVISQYAKDDLVIIWATTVLGILFAVLIILIIPVDSPIRIGDSNILSRLGVYTYGLYLYHILAINLLKQLFDKYDLHYEENILMSSVFVALSLLVSIICAYCSYHLFEKQFLKLKKYFRRGQDPLAVPLARNI
jgi:peptidoglycan/LPS O-acetylase OafA/YrhL